MSGRYPPASLAALGVCALSLALWLLRTPYMGLQHDALFYAMDAQERAWPGLLARDLYFQHGTQGSHSLFIPLYAWVMKLLGAPLAALVYTLTLLMAWLIGIWRLLRQLGGSRSAACWGLSAIALVDSHYEPLHMLRWAEPFTTARLAAEAMTLWSLSAVIGGQRVQAVLYALLALMLHPLIGWPVMATVMLTLLVPPTAHGGPDMRRIGVLSLLIVVVIALAGLAGWSPADRVWQHFDPDWWQVVMARNPMTVLQAWPVATGADKLAMLGWLALAAGTLENHQDAVARQMRQATWALLWCAGLALVIWMVACQVQMVLPVQLQLWRVLWLVSLLSAALWGLWVARVDLRRTEHRVTAVLLLCALLADAGWQWPLVALTALHRHSSSAISPRVSHTLRAWLAALACLCWALPALWPTPGPWLQWSTEVWAPLVSASLSLADVPARRLLLCMTLGLAIWMTARSEWRNTAHSLTAVALVLTVLSGGVWLNDARRQVTPPPAWIDTLRQQIPEGHSVLWIRPTQEIWLQLQRPAWISGSQAAPALFFRDLAVEWQRRVSLARWIDLDLNIRPMNGTAPVSGRQPLDITRALSLCREPTLDVVLIDGAPTGVDRVIQRPGSSALGLVDCRARRMSSR
jgi:hypothetical protein